MAERFAYEAWICRCNMRHPMEDETCPKCGMHWQEGRKIAREPDTGEEHEEQLPA